MFTVSDAYKSAIKRPAIRTRVNGSIAGLRFTDDNILEGSFSIANQNSGNDNVQIGTVYIGELSITLRGLAIGRYQLNGAEIIPVFELLLEDGVTWEVVPLGRYYVGEANHTAAGVSIKAYDAMSKLDKRCSGASISGTPYQLAKLACESCRLSLATSQADFSTFANGMETLSLWQEGTDIETWRDFISWVAQSCACYATANRNGQIVFRPYTQTIVDTVDPEGRFKGASYSDYETRYTGLYCTNIKDNTVDYYSLAQDNGLTYSLGSNPFLQYGTPESKEVLRRAILNRLTLIQYVPFTVTLPGNPAYDLGDVLSFPDGLGDGSKLFCVNKITWNYHRGIKLEGVGENPALASARSRSDKNIAGLASKINDDAIYYKNVVNADEITIPDGGNARVIVFDYVTSKKTHVDFHAEIKGYVETTEEYDSSMDAYTENDGVICVSYFSGGSEITEYYPADTFFDGTHLLHLLYTWWASANVLGTFEVFIRCEGCSLIIEAGDARAYISGVGIVGEGAWDGAVHVSDNFAPIDFRISRKGFTTEIEDKFVTPHAPSPTQNVIRRNFFTTVFKSFTHSIVGSALHRFSVYNASEMTYNNAIISGDHWSVNDRTQLGMVVTPNCIVDRILQVTSRNSGNDVTYLVSFDEGDTWWTYVDRWAEPDYTQDVYGMFEGTMRSITPSQWAEKLNGTIMVQAILIENATLTDIQIYMEVYQ